MPRLRRPILLATGALVLALVAHADAQDPAPICTTPETCNAILGPAHVDMADAIRGALSDKPVSALCADAASCKAVVADRYATIIQAAKILQSIAPWPAKTAVAPVTIVIGGNPYAAAPYTLEAQLVGVNGPGILVHFIVDGVLRRVESTARYCLFGGDSACVSGRLGAGTHEIRAQVVRQTAPGVVDFIAEASLAVIEP
jgi:hypothetical protein